jgi:hypothetical protein
MAELKIKADSGGGTVSFKGPATTTSNAAVQLTLPVDDGAADQYLKTDGSGALSWATVSTGVDNVTSDNYGIIVQTTNASNDSTVLIKGNEAKDARLYMYADESDDNADMWRIVASASDGTFAIQNYAGGAWENSILLYGNGAAKFYKDNTLMCETSNNGLAFPSGKGIDFSATADSSGTSTSEVLEDYEVGTWAPAFTNAPTISGAHGSYIKIGDMVFAYWQFNTSSDGPASHARINNLPFTSTAANPACGGTAWDYRTNSAINAHQSPGSTSLFFYHQNGTAMMGDSAEFESEEFRGCTIYQTA